MKEFKYPLLAKFVYRWANVPLTFLLLIHWASSVIGLTESWTYSLPLIINTAVIILLNLFYFRSYKTFPFKFQIDNEKMICSDYMNGDKIVELNLKDIDKLKGGIFTGQPTRPIYIEATSKNIRIGMHQHVKGLNKMLTIILSNVSDELYNQMLSDAKLLNDAQKELIKNRASKKKKKKGK
ncbi:MAG: hypothetical protein K9J12_03175 [Melioribacteraceae bacterium]|nr:hypothetical protein [Melioribacteraceae bacterium]MCF8265777.1 hypothetical protein [Melioribacteraceae bacterium]MCF8431850.1 hypothetical protein [Melioribacteraceae bacterium]